MLLALGVAIVVIWLIVQWIILFTAAYPRGMFDFVAGVVRWQTRVTAYTLGLVDRYPPFTLDASITATATAAPVVPLAPAQWYADLTGRHMHRYWDGAQWTAHVADDGRTAYDPLEGPGAGAQG